MYAIYLRKSRADIEAENRGEGETLLRHKNTLLKLSRERNFEIGKIYTEIVSGESIASRPKMQRLLEDVDNCRWTGVLVMEIERLCRGNSIDQGIVAQAFKESGTLIITPQKTYNPQDESDEEYFEFSLFMSRREYKTINRRLSAGKKAAALEGKFIGSCAPYGYEKIRTKEGCTLKANEFEAGILKNIFEWYVNGLECEYGVKKLGCYSIAKKLDEMCIPTRNGGKWSPSTIRDILSNPVYIGKIRTDYYTQTRKKGRTRNSDTQKTVNGLHAPLISDELFKAANKERTRGNILPIKQEKTLSNPLAGIIVCSNCSKNMIRRENKSRGKASVLCTMHNCKNVSSYFDIVETALISELGSFYKTLVLDDYENKIINSSDTDRALVFSIEREIKKCEAMIERVFELTESRIYTDSEYIKRRKTLDERKKALEKARTNAIASIARKEQAVQFSNHCLKQTQGFSSYYEALQEAEFKNEFIKKFVKKVLYTKQNKGREFRLDIFVRMPQNHRYEK